MKKNENEMGEWLDSFNGQWDTEEPSLGHQNRFMERLSKPKKKFPYRTVFAVAASVVILLGIFINHELATSKSATAAMSPEVKETHLYFNSIIKKELAVLKKENTPESRQMVEDALKQMADLDNDYKKLTTELAEKGESKQLIHAMITNLQTRISFLEQVEKQIEFIKKIKASYHEKNTI